MPANHTPDVGCYVPSPEEIASEAAMIRQRNLAAKRKKKTSIAEHQPRVVRMHEHGRVIRKGCYAN
jgi:hypothetical protein